MEDGQKGQCMIWPPVSRVPNFGRVCKGREGMMYFSSVGDLIGVVFMEL